MKTLIIYCEAPECKRTFRTQESLEDHKKAEHSSSNQSGSYRFRCSNCPKILSTKQSLKEHQYTHTGEKPYKCLEAGCGLYFRQSSQLSNHKKVHFEMKKNATEESSINLVFLSSLITQERPVTWKIPAGPYTVSDAELPKLGPKEFVKLRVLD